MRTDLHIHSIYSNDGELGIREILDSCMESGVRTFSITDHNTVRGNREAAGHSAGFRNLSFIPGIEIDCSYKGTDLHLLGYRIDLDSDDFDVLEQQVRQQRLNAVPQMISNLEALGMDINLDELMLKSEDEAPTPEQFAELLLESPDRYLNSRLKPYLPGGQRSDMPLINFYLDFFAQGKPAYVKIDHLDFADAIALVRHNGGIPVVAHPGLNLKEKEEVVNELLDRGAMGLEVFNNYHDRDQADYFAREIMKRKGIMTCGSDFHGLTKPRISIGQYIFLDPYREYLESCIHGLLS